jgi:hypothetical protein
VLAVQLPGNGDAGDELDDVPLSLERAVGERDG